MRANDVEPTRLDAAVAAMRTFLDQLPKQFKVGLVAFSSEPEVLAPPTATATRCATRSRYLEPEAGTAIGDGIEVAVKHAAELARARPASQRKPGRVVPAAIVLALRRRAEPRHPPAAPGGPACAKTAGVRVYAVVARHAERRRSRSASGPS